MPPIPYPKKPNYYSKYRDKNFHPKPEPMLFWLLRNGIGEDDSWSFINLSEVF